RGRIAAYVRPLAVRRSDSLSTLIGGDVRLICENEQPTGSFKIRGASNAVLSLLGHGVGGLTTASTGNHARAVAHLGHCHDLPVRAFVSRDVSDGRVRRLREHGAEVDATAADQTGAIERAQAYADTHGYGFVPPFDHPAVIAGQGTLGLELADALPTLDDVVVPVSGGGLAAGVAIAIKHALSHVRITGVCADRAPAMKAALDAGHPVEVRESATVAESLRGDLGPDNRYTFRLVRDHLDAVELVDEDAIINAQDHLFDVDSVDAEGAAAAGGAYVTSYPHAFTGRRVAVIVTGAADQVGATQVIYMNSPTRDSYRR
ncbi:MAG: pyridoxal-phosphate dependent enzyme, partial [Actinomycetia bacterium]|nr:pyridoxal-phosphate dependent enzyme [Actinomycetes bacterium]